MKLDGMLSLSGYTPKGKLVIAGLFRLHDTFGWSLNICASALAKGNAMCDWESFASDARCAGWSTRKIRAAISDAAYIGWGRNFRTALLEEVDKRLGIA